MPRADARIESVTASAFEIPTDQPESDGTLAWSSTTLVLAEVTAAGKRGIGYTYAHPAAGYLIATKLNEVLQGRDALATGACWTAMVAALRNQGGAGLSAMAVSAVDAALWDLKGRILDAPVVTLLGAARDAVAVYGSGGFTSYSDHDLQTQLGGWAENGTAQVKMKIGRVPDDDPRRMSLARDAIGDDVALMVDANGAYTRKQALDMAQRGIDLGVVWFEEPVSSEDLQGLRLLRDRVPSPIEVTAGEYGFDCRYFRRMLEAGAVDVLAGGRHPLRRHYRVHGSGCSGAGIRDAAVGALRARSPLPPLLCGEEDDQRRVVSRSRPDRADAVRRRAAPEGRLHRAGSRPSRPRPRIPSCRRGTLPGEPAPCLKPTPSHRRAGGRARRTGRRAARGGCRRSPVRRAGARDLFDGCLPLPPGADRRRHPPRRGRGRARARGLPQVRRAGHRARRRHQPRRAVLQCLGGHRLLEIHEPYPRARPRRAHGLGGARLRARRPARRGGTAWPDLRPRPLDPQPQHSGRHDRQQLLRRAFHHGRTHRRQRGGARHPDL